MSPEHTEVLIVGAGPVGMAVAAALAQEGVHHLIVEKRRTGLNTSRAAVVHAETLEVLERIGAAAPMTARGVRRDSFVLRERDRPLVELNFSALPTRHPYLLMIPQQVTEAVLADRVAELGGSIRRGVEVRNIVQEKDGVVAELVEDGVSRFVQAAYVVGADGMHSVVREAAGIGFDGESYAGSFVLADVEVSGPLAHGEVALFVSAAGLCVVAPLPGGTFRIVANVDDAPELPTASDIQAILDARGPTARSRVGRVDWSSRFRIHHRLASTYRNGRLFLAGDAAHVHSPAGGQGMNTGLIDGVVLGELLASVIKGSRPESDLALYETLRRPAAVAVLEMAGRLTRMATATNPLRRMLRNVALSAVNRVPPLKRRIAMNLSGLARSGLSKAPATTGPH